MMNHSESLSPSLVTNVSVRFVENGTDGLIAWASLIIANSVKLDRIAVRRGRDGNLFLTYPAKAASRGSKPYYFNPISSNAAEVVKAAVLARMASLTDAVSKEDAQDQ